MIPPTSGPTPALQLPHGFQINVLSSSLVSRLKQHRKIETGSVIRNKPPKKDALIQRSMSECHINVAESQTDEEDDEPKQGRRISGFSLSRSSKQQHRHNSALSDGESSLLPRLESSNARSHSNSRHESRNGSRLECRRTTSAGRSAAAQSRSSGRKSAGSCATTSKFTNRSVSYPINVVKRDGVFQPADKYMVGRLAVRDVGHTSVCDYHTYTLPSVDTCSSNGDANSPRLSDYLGESPRSFPTGSGKKRMKVSWKAGHQQGEVSASRMDKSVISRDATITSCISGSPATPLKQQVKPQPEDTFAFKRPVYNSGRSCVNSIGLRWQIQVPGEDEGNGVATASNEDNRVQIKETLSNTTNTSKPMWSYLVTSDTKPMPHEEPMAQVIPSSISTGASASKFQSPPGSKTNGKPRHRKDVHPVSTALDQNGRNVSKTRWAVPSSSASGLEPERVIMERLQMVKRPSNSKMLQLDPSSAGLMTSNSAARKFRQAMIAAGRADEIEEFDESMHAIEFHLPKRVPLNKEVQSPIFQKVKNITNDDTYGTATCSTDDKAASIYEHDGTSSPTKSRSTVYC